MRYGRDANESQKSVPQFNQEAFGLISVALSAVSAFKHVKSYRPVCEQKLHRNGAFLMQVMSCQK
jgi:hypothetical protein